MLAGATAGFRAFAAVVAVQHLRALVAAVDGVVTKHCLGLLIGSTTAALSQWVRIHCVQVVVSAG